LTLAGVVKEDLACSGSSLPKLWPIGLGRYARHALDIMLGETYQQPQASSVKRRASGQFRMILISKENIKRYKRQAIKYLTFKNMGLYKN